MSRVGVPVKPEYSAMYMPELTLLVLPTVIVVSVPSATLYQAWDLGAVPKSHNCVKPFGGVIVPGLDTAV